ncbi:MAG: YcjX family protein [Rhizobiales bacterium]|nr:YcjX family protein [Hyphomicrobiales bacterium]
MTLATITDETRLALATLAERATGLVTPSLRLGVTGLARAGKTVFITALVHNLIHGGRLPVFKAYASGRVTGAGLQPQPDDAVPRFDYEDHVRALVEKRIWPESTRRISELRLTIRYESASFFSRRLGRGKLHLDIVDYPGEWLLDLTLLSRDYATWSGEALAFARAEGHDAVAAPWLARLATVDPGAPEDETLARELAALFTEYLRACRRSDRVATQPPGRFLMPGDLDGSPALTFAPLPVEGTPPAGSLAAMMARRYESYKSAVVRPFFRDHFARLDRQIVLVDVLDALDAGATALADLEGALADVLSAFRIGGTGWFSSLVTRRIDRILFAATKADHLHHGDHDRLEAILARLVAGAVGRAKFAGARVEVLALASVRATREGTVSRRGEALPSIIGTPLPGETVEGRAFDGTSEIAMFPGDLPDDPAPVFTSGAPVPLRFVRFRPPKLEQTAEGLTLSLPHIRLDRALEFLIGDRLS